MPLLISSNPTYTVSAVSQVSEGTSILFTVTANVPNGTVLYWTNAGTTSADDFVQAVTFGSFTMNSGTGSVTLTPISDLTIDDSETIIFQVRENSIAGPIVATATATVRDQAVVTRILNNWTATGGFVSATEITESGRIDFIITTVGLSDGTTLYWTNAGTTSASDFLQNVNSGSFIVTSNQGTFSLNIAPDGWPAEGPETVVIQIRTGSISGTIIAVSAPLTITDTNYPPLPGDFIFGGYFAGYVSYNGDNVATHYLIVSPKGGGRAASIQFATGFIGSPGTNDPINGLNNTLNMNNSQHPAAQFCRGLQINGYTDWYMPAPLEQNIIYYNLKPTTGANNTSNGANLYAIPQRPNNYTATDPVQTASTLFRTGGAQSYETDLCWDSMQEFNGAGYAFRTFFGTGSSYPPAFTDSKTTFRQVRAVRRHPIVAPVVPGAPTITGVTATSAGAVQINYTAPASNGGATILSYTAISSPGGVSATVSTSGSGSITVSGLAAAQSYTFRVYATNSVGPSSFSVASSAVIPTPGSIDLPALTAAAIRTFYPGAPDGNYYYRPSGYGSTIQCYTVFTSAPAGKGYVLVARGRESTDWWNNTGQNFAAGLLQTNLDVNTPIAVAPQAFVNALIGSQWNGIRIITNRRNIGDSWLFVGTSSASFSWTYFQQSASTVNATAQRYNSAFLGGGLNTNWGSGSNWTDTLNYGGGNDCQRTFTWSWGGHGSWQGWSGGSSCTPAGSFQNGGEGHAINLANVYIEC